jgi:hypothetical protein
VSGHAWALRGPVYGRLKVGGIRRKQPIESTGSNEQSPQVKGDAPYHGEEKEDERAYLVLPDGNKGRLPQCGHRLSKSVATYLPQSSSTRISDLSIFLQASNRSLHFRQVGMARTPLIYKAKAATPRDTGESAPDYHSAGNGTNRPVAMSQTHQQRTMPPITAARRAMRGLTSSSQMTKKGRLPQCGHDLLTPVCSRKRPARCSPYKRPIPSKSFSWESVRLHVFFQASNRFLHFRQVGMARTPLIYKAKAATPRDTGESSGQTLVGYPPACSHAGDGVSRDWAQKTPRQGGTGRQPASRSVSARQPAMTSVILVFASL